MGGRQRMLYTARTHTSGGLDGGASLTSDGRPDVELSDPGTGWYGGTANRAIDGASRDGG